MLSPRQVIQIDIDARMLSIPGAGGHKITVAFKNARAAHVQSDITEMIQEAIDTLDEELEDILSPSITPDENEVGPSPIVVNAGEEISPDDIIIDESPEEQADTIQIICRKSKSKQSPHKKQQPVNPAVENNSAKKEI